MSSVRTSWWARTEWEFTFRWRWCMIGWIWVSTASGWSGSLHLGPAGLYVVHHHRVTTWSGS